MSEIHTIGIPRGLMAYRDGVLWKEFFEKLGFRCLVSSKSDREILETGTARAVDEACLPFKMYLGHVIWLSGKCDAVFVPRTGGYKSKEKMCTRYEALPDLVRNIFREEHIRVLTVSYDWYMKTTEEKVFLELGMPVFVDEKGHLMGAFGIAVLSKEQQEEGKFSFDVAEMEFKTREITCGKSANHCEIICVYRDGQLVDSWGNRCDNGAVR